MKAKASDNATKEMVCGCTAGLADAISGFPFDTIKVRLQAEPGRYTGVWQCFTDIWRKEGASALYRGIGPPLIGGALETGINYLVYSRTLEALKGDAPEAPMHVVPAAAAVGGFALSFILGPTELIKVSGDRYGTSLQCFRHLLHTEGLRGVTRGLGATILREVPGNMLFFSIYEGLRRTLPGRPAVGEGHRSALQVLEDASSAVLCGGLAGMGMWAAILPLDVAKTRLQTAVPGSAWDVGVAQHLRLLWREARWKALFSGLTPTLVRAFPSNACQWLAWELAMQHVTIPSGESLLPLGRGGEGAGVKASAPSGVGMPWAATGLAAGLDEW